jgi:hypothetical protein
MGESSEINMIHQLCQLNESLSISENLWNTTMNFFKASCDRANHWTYLRYKTNLLQIHQGFVNGLQ